MRRLTMAGCVLVTGLAGCGGGLPFTGGGQAASTGPADAGAQLYGVALDAGVATLIADQCPDLSFQTEARDALVAATSASLTEQGITPEEAQALQGAVPSERLQSDIVAYMEQKELAVGQTDGFCAAGRAEIAAGSRIGSLLR